tara:strand:+ start:8110 stop:8355 length:246 start_codon:yes stop_codon:yes gene_type:complete
MNQIEGYSCRIEDPTGEIIITSTVSQAHLKKHVTKWNLLQKPLNPKHCRKTVTVGTRDYAKLKNGLADSERIVKQKIGGLE